MHSESGRGGRPGETPGAAMDDDLRLGWVAGLPADADVTRVLGLALPHAVAGAAGLGGLVHLSGREPGTLDLAAVIGLPPDLTGAWDHLGDAATPGLAPARAIATGRPVWSQARPPTPDRTQGHPRGVLSVPLRAGGDVIGALSVLADREPPRDRVHYLGQVAALVGDRLASARRWRSSGTHPWWEIGTDEIPAEHRLMRAVRAGRWSWDLSTGLLDTDEVAESLLVKAGIDRYDWDHHILTWLAHIYPADRGQVEQEITRSRREDSAYVVEYRVQDSAGRLSWLLVCGWWEHDDTGRLVRMVGYTWDVTDRRSSEAWLAGLTDSYPLPTYVIAPDDHVTWCNAVAREVAALRQVEIVGRVPWEVFPELREQGVPDVLAAARAAPGRPASKTVTSWEAFRGDSGGLGHYEVNAVGITDYVVVTLTDVTDKAEAAEAAAERRERLTGLNAALIQACTPRHVVDAVLTHVVPLLSADSALIHDLTGPEPQVAGSRGCSPELLRQVATLSWQERMEARAVASAQIQLVKSVGELAERWPHLVPLARMGRGQAWAIVPLVTADAQVGSVVLGWHTPRVFDGEAEALLGTVAVAVAAAFARAAEFREAQQRAERLQHELMPGRLPALTAASAAAQYRTASTAGIGGDWYDAIALPGGRTLAVVGDVAGDGIDEPVVMGILRQAIAAIAAMDLVPDELLAYANDVTLRLGSVQATVLLALYDPATGVLSLTSSGHPPPLMMAPGRPPAVLDMPIGKPLGLPHVPPEVAEVTVPDGTLLTLYTDGLLGLDDPDPARLAEVITRHAVSTPLPSDPARRAPWLDDLCHAAMATLLPESRPDDAALLALTLGRIPADHIATWDMPRIPESAQTARATVSDRLQRWGLDALVWPADQVVSELVGNAVRHAVGIGVSAAHAAVGDIRVRLLRLVDQLVIEVYDGSKAAPYVRHPSYDQEFGRGLPIVSVLAHRWGTRRVGTDEPDDADPTTPSKCVWAALSLTEERDDQVFL